MNANWLVNNTAPGGGGHRQLPPQQQQQQQQHEAPAHPSQVNTAASSSSPHPPPLRSSAGSSNGPLPPAFSSFTGTGTGSGGTPKHADANNLGPATLTFHSSPPSTSTASPAGYRSMGSAAPYPTNSAAVLSASGGNTGAVGGGVGSFHRPPTMQQQYQMRGAFLSGPSPPATTTTTMTTSTNVNTTSVTMTGGVSYGSGGSVGGGPYAQWRGGGGGPGQGSSGGDASQRRRSGSGKSGSGGGRQGSSSSGSQQRQHQQQQQVHLPPRSFYGRNRGGGGGGVGMGAGVGGAEVAANLESQLAAVEPPHPAGAAEGGGNFGSPSQPASYQQQSTSGMFATPTANSTSASALPPYPSSPPGHPITRRGSASLSSGGLGSSAGPGGRFSSANPQHQQHMSSPPSAGGASAALPHGSSEVPVNGDGVAAASSSSPSPPPSSFQQQPPQPRQQQQATVPGMSRPGALVGVSAATVHARCDERPTVALSQNIMSVYQAINEIFYQERQRLLSAAPAAKLTPAAPAVRKYEDAAGHYVPCDGEVIAERYVYKGLIGQGSFGKVLQCVDRKYDEPVAVKIIRSGPYFESQGWFEAQVVAHLNNDPALQNLVVQLRKVFLWKGHMVLVFEPLSFSLYKLITLTKHNGVSLDLTRKFAYQMVKVLLVLEQHQPPIIHCDLKPENVLLRDPSRSGVRVIDFGSACYQQQTEWTLPPAQVSLPASSPSATAGPPWDGAAETTGTSAAAAAAATGAAPPDVDGGSGDPGVSADVIAALAGAAATSAPATNALPAAPLANTVVDPTVEVIMPKYIQSRYYRSPEVILELGYTTAIDRWSLGCFLVEMHTGRPLFQGNNEADMLAYFTLVRGPLPDYMIASSPKRTRLYHTCCASAGEEDNAHGGTSNNAQLLGSSSGGTAAAVAQSLLLQQPQRAASPLLAFTTPPSPRLTPLTDAAGHAPGSPFFLRAPQVESADSATAKEVAKGDANATPLQRILGVRTGGPRGCRAGQPGHDEEAYELFCDFIERLLQYDPRKRMSCQEAVQHPFLEPIRALEARAAAAAAAAGSSTTAPSAAVEAPPPAGTVDAAPTAPVGAAPPPPNTSSEAASA